MKLTPFINAMSAAVYIVLVVLLIWSLQTFSSLEDTIFIPMFMLSLLVLSVAIMGFLFFFKSLFLYMDGHKDKALEFFLKTVGFFACFVLVFFIVFIYSMAK
jgi:predicted membrane channel-forming protein YqfA (hemolysin III family)